MKYKIFFLSLTLIPLILNPLGSNIFELPKLSLAALILAISGLIIVAQSFAKPDFQIKFNRYVYALLGLWLLSLTISTIFSVAPQLSLWGSYDRVQGLYSQLIYIGFFIMFFHLFAKEEHQNFFLKSLVGVAVFTSIHAILQQFGIGVFSPAAMQEFLHRSFATLGHPNFLGQFLLLPFWAGIYLSVHHKNKRWLYLGFTALILVALLLTENRASILGVVIGGLFFAALKTNIISKYKYLLYTALPLAFISFIVFAAPSLRSLETRYHLWKGSLLLFPDNPIFGTGLESFELVFQKVSTTEFFKLEQLYTIADRAHNEYLDILVNQGLFGLLVYGFCLASLLYLIIKNRHQKSVNLLGAALVSILVSNFFSFSLTVHQLLFMALIALILNQTLKLKSVTFKRNLAVLFGFGIAFAVFLQVIFISSKAIYADSLYKIGVQNIYNGSFETGISRINHASNINPHQGDIHFHLADILFLMGKELKNDYVLKDAELALEPAGRFTNYHFRYLFAAARLKTYLQEFDEAEKLYLKSVALAPTNPIILKEWGAMLYLKGDYLGAIEKMEKFLSFIPDYWKNKNNLDQLSQEDKEQYRLFIKHVPDLWDVFAYLSRSYAEIGKEAQSSYYFQFVEPKEKGGN